MSSLKSSLSDLSLPELTKQGMAFDALLGVEPSAREDLDFGGRMQVIAITRQSRAYVINASLNRALQHCPHCGSDKLRLHGRFLLRQADLPYVDPKTQFPYSVEYSISSQRYLCDSCGKGTTELMPDLAKPAVTTSRITYRLSCWLIYKLQTAESYPQIAATLGYSAVWLRKWNAELKPIFGLGLKPSKPGRKKSLAKDAA